MGNGVYFLDLPVVDYKKALYLQQTIVDAKKAGVLKEDVVLLLEHWPVFTLGRRGGMENLLVSGTFLGEQKVQIVQAERGGNITFHGPGQLVGYPIIDLTARRLTVVDYVASLEQTMVDTLSDWGIEASGNPENRGVWMGNTKLGSVGICIRRGITFHGFALNVNLSLKPFSWVNPCGLHNIHITSMKKELGRELSMDRVRTTVKAHLNRLLKAKTVSCCPPALEDLLETADLKPPV
jgi:lipoate-protein ligase B